jgi:hypothetical protein
MYYPSLSYTYFVSIALLNFEMNSVWKALPLDHSTVFADVVWSLVTII